MRSIISPRYQCECDNILDKPCTGRHSLPGAIPPRATGPSVPSSRPPATMQPTRVATARDAVARIQRGDQRAFNALFLEHYSPLSEYTNALVHSADVAEDIVQGVFVSVWECRQSWRPRNGPRAYLFGACRNRALDYLRHAHVVSASMHHT